MNGSSQKFESGTDIVFLGDALDVLSAEIPDNSVELIFADPPYNIGKQFDDFADRWPSEKSYVSWCEHWLDLCIKKLSRNGSIYFMTSTQAMPYIDIYLRQRLTVLSRVVWHYDSSGVQARRYFGSLYEPILYCVRDSENYIFNADAVKVEVRTGAKRKLIDYRKSNPSQYNTTKVPGNVWYFPRVRYRMDEYEEHPSQKPESLLTRIITASSNPGDTVLDPFAGTFTTAAVAQRLGRKSVSIEKAKKYVAIGLRRLRIADQFEGQKLQPPAKSFRRRETAPESSLFGVA